MPDVVRWCVVCQRKTLMVPGPKTGSLVCTCCRGVYDA